jgi:OFA family oxalate/formate antiporter-like MFS transporter
LSQLKLIPAYGLPATFQILGASFLVMTMVGALLLRNPPAGYRPEGWSPAAAKSAALAQEFTPGEMLRTPTFYLMWLGYALGCSAGLMVISQLVPFAKSVGIAAATLSTMTLVVGAFGNASGRILSGWMSDRLGRINVLRTMIGICIVAMPALYAAGSNPLLLYMAVFVVYWCYGTQLSVNGVAASDFWGTKNAGINYGILFTAWGVAGILGPRIGGVLFDRYHNYQAAFYTAAGLAAIALLCELGARRPAIGPLRKP